MRLPGDEAKLQIAQERAMELKQEVEDCCGRFALVRVVPSSLPDYRRAESLSGHDAPMVRSQRVDLQRVSFEAGVIEPRGALLLTWPHF